MNKQIVLVAHNIRSTHNIGSLLRSCDGLGIKKVYLTGYSPYPASKNETRLPHIARQLDSQIHKTALGAENTVAWEYIENPLQAVSLLKSEGYQVAVLEQSKNSRKLHKFKTPQKIALIIGEEVNGVSKELINISDITLEIPMFGEKESFNVSVAAAIALYHFRFS